jgi:hypothetical protein
VRRGPSPIIPIRTRYHQGTLVEQDKPESALSNRICAANAQNTVLLYSSCRARPDQDPSYHTFQGQRDLDQRRGTSRQPSTVRTEVSKRFSGRSVRGFSSPQYVVEDLVEHSCRSSSMAGCGRVGVSVDYLFLVLLGAGFGLARFVRRVVGALSSSDSALDSSSSSSSSSSSADSDTVL